jgi:hypothetical protein
MKNKISRSAVDRPATAILVSEDARKNFDDILESCRSSELSFGRFELELMKRLAVLGCCLIRLYLTARHERLDVQPFLNDGTYRLGDGCAQRTLKTVYGKVTYARRYLQSCVGGSGIFPLDIELGLTWDALSPWAMQWVAQLATRMSFKASQMVFKAVLHWAPATETIEQVVLGMGRDAAPFMQQLQPPKEDGEVLVIEVDGKCPPTATAAELAKRRGRRKPRHEKDCQCGCQRHRGQVKRQQRGRKKRRKKGDKSKNGKEVVVVVMYTLKRGVDGKLHGPINKKLYATFAGRQAAADWARAEATKRGFGPDTTKTVQVVSDGAKGLKDKMEGHFPKAIFTLDVWHVVERLWRVGRHYHSEGSEALESFVDDLKALVYAGQPEALLKRLKSFLEQVPLNGPGTKGRRDVLKSQIGYVGRRVDMMRYGEWSAQDLVIGSGQVEGAVRHLVGERFDCAGMRWVKEKAEMLLHLRCIELNGDWPTFVDWFQRTNHARLRKRKRVRVLTDQATKLKPKAQNRQHK